MDAHAALTVLFAFIIAFAVLAYVAMDGFDLGLAILFPLFPDKHDRDVMMNTVAPVWDGNETWLVLAATILFGAFPFVYSLLLSAFFLPLLIMLAALILRGVAFEFRYKAVALRRVWDVGFAGGSLLAAFVQGVAIGAMVQELPIQEGHYVGGPFGWFSPFAPPSVLFTRRIRSSPAGSTT